MEWEGEEEEILMDHVDSSRQCERDRRESGRVEKGGLEADSGAINTSEVSKVFHET